MHISIYTLHLRQTVPPAEHLHLLLAQATLLPPLLFLDLLTKPKTQIRFGFPNLSFLSYANPNQINPPQLC